MGTGEGEGGGQPPSARLEVPASHSQRGWGWASLSLSADLSGRRVKVPLVPSPPTRGPSMDGRAGGQGRWVHLPQRHHGSCGLSLPLQALPSQSRPQRIGPGSCFPPEKEGARSSAPAPGLREFALLPASLWKFASPAPAEAPAPPQPSLATWPTGLGPLLAPSRRLLKRQLPHVSASVTTLGTDSEARISKPREGAGLYCTPEHESSSSPSGSQPQPRKSPREL